MGDIIEATGFVLSSMPVGEYDRRIVLLTKEKGKIPVFANGSRRPGNSLSGATRAFSFGIFQLFEGRSYYTLRQANITNTFESLYSDLDSTLYACYFCEMTDYYARENLDGASMINLLYATFKALANENIPNKLVRRIFEIKLIGINGELPDFFDEGQISLLNAFLVNNHIISGINDSTLYTLQFIATSPIEKLYTFNVSKEVLFELSCICDRIVAATIDKSMKSVEMLD